MFAVQVILIYSNNDNQHVRYTSWTLLIVPFFFHLQETKPLQEENATMKAEVSFELIKWEFLALK